MAQSNNSGRPLATKLGIRPGQRMALINATVDVIRHARDAGPRALAVAEAVNGLPPDALDLEYAHVFVDEARMLDAALPALKWRLVPAGMIWVSWPKKASKRQTDVTEDVIRAVALSIGLVDVKVCAIDAVWSGLKLVIPKKQRPGAPRPAIQPG